MKENNNKKQRISRDNINFNYFYLCNKLER